MSRRNSKKTVARPDIDEMLAHEGISLDPVETLADPNIKTYLLGILGSDLAPEMKYQRFTDLFRRERQVRDRVIEHIKKQIDGKSVSVDQAVTQVMQELQVWNPDRIREDIERAIRRALEWLANTQQEDGGWAIIGGRSVFWETAFSTRCLNAALMLGDASLAGDRTRAAFERGVRWLNAHLDGWSFEGCAVGECLPAYNISLAAMCFYEIGQEHFVKTYSAQLDAGMKRLANSRCPDGGWYSRPWVSVPDNSLSSCSSEIGATSFAIRACVPRSDKGSLKAAEQALAYLLLAATEDGSWNDPYGRPSVNKTCDALLAIQAAQSAGIKHKGFTSAIKKAVHWLQSQEKPILREGLIEGWGWDYLPAEMDIGPFEEYFMRGEKIRDEDRKILERAYTRNDLTGNYRLAPDLTEEESRSLTRVFERSGYGYDSMATCLSLEALVKLEAPELSVLVKNCKWLVENQADSGETVKAGCWPTNTARITLSLIEYYKQLRAYSTSLTEPSHHSTAS